ncbi:Protein let-756 [Caenorhabditis elegans]|uniref:Protein let-756 n=1 Tax=Caenorhabditis elegans TaxID=6239 RepID=LE756_CAEEL|nr:Protein let-756 [Caenorhabditis elegans]Q11184.2 RecName: Full=Protein let-756; AltName: Full=Lethal protein 756 [Caenorhabditis elegans]CAA09234.1 LET-756 protein [Caenorhabditis elegans]CCD63193.1 Protein let-756 [Caenorhabditis elegans]|eukprot:NP_498403.1 Protein let-756 [Caenorhabditis elegans]
MAVPAASSIVSYGGAATSNFLTTPVTPFLAGFYNSNFVTDRINSCAPYRVDRIRKQLQDEEENGYPPADDRRRGALFCRSGTWLEMLPIENPDDGSTRVKVHGTKEESSKFSIVEFVSVAMSLVSIRGVETKNFICMDPSGKLYATPSSNYSTECVFLEEMMENYYNLYASCAYGDRFNPWYIELRRSGKPRRGPNSKKRRKASHFLVVHHDLDRLRSPVPNGNDVTDLVVASLFHQPPSHPLFRQQTVTKPPNPHRISNLRAKVEMTNQAEKQRLLEEKKRRREKKKRRREDRLRKEEQIREARRQELKSLREEELRRRYQQQQQQQASTQTRYNRPQNPANPYPTYRPLPTRSTVQSPRPAYNPYWQSPVTQAPHHNSHHHHHHHPRVSSSSDPQQRHQSQQHYLAQTVSNPNRQNVNYQRYP